MKDKLQAELLAKIKAGIKPSQLKKPKPKPSPKTVSPPSIAESDNGYSSDPERTPIPSDDGYSSEENINETIARQNLTNTPPSRNESNELKEALAKSLQTQITSLKRQLQTYKDFKDADLKIKEDLKKSLLALNQDNEKLKQELVQKDKTIKDLQEKNQDLTKTIAALKNQAKSTGSINPEPFKTFLCSDCNQTKPQEQLSRVFGKFFFCLECSKQARLTATQQKNPPVEEFICHLCARGKKEIPTRMKLDETLTEYLVCQECRPTAKEFNEADLITDELWEKYPYSSASEILEKEFGIVRHKE